MNDKSRQWLAHRAGPTMGVISLIIFTPIYVSIVYYFAEKDLGEDIFLEVFLLGLMALLIFIPILMIKGWSMFSTWLGLLPAADGGGPGWKRVQKTWPARIFWTSLWFTTCGLLWWVSLWLIKNYEWGVPLAAFLIFLWIPSSFLLILHGLWLGIASRERSEKA